MNDSGLDSTSKWAELVHYEGLGQLLRGAGVGPERAEDIVRQFLSSDSQEQIGKLLHEDLASIRAEFSEDLGAVRSELSGGLKGCGIAVDSFRREAEGYKWMVLRTMRFNCVGLVVVVTLELLSVILAAYQLGRG